MSGNLRAALNVERTANGQYEWVITAIDSTVGTMPTVDRSKLTYATEAEARLAGEKALDEMRDE